MGKQPPFILPWEPNYTAHRDAQRRREDIHGLLADREHLTETDAPSIAPEHSEQREPAYARVR